MKTVGQGKLTRFRKLRGLTMEEAGARIVVNGKPTSRVTWHGWESRGKLPRPPFMVELERNGIADASDFYTPEADELPVNQSNAPGQPALL